MISTFDTERGRLAFAFDSFWGGDKYRCPSSPTMGRGALTRWIPRRDAEGKETGNFDEQVVLHFESYLVPHPGEPLAAFRTRMALAGYVNICQPIVDAYVDAVTSPVKRDLGKLDRYLSSLDGRGRTWADHMEEVARWSAVYGFCATVLDVPAENPSTSLADEEARGVGLRATLVHPTSFAWIDVDPDGDVCEFAYADTPYLPDETGKALVRFWVYTREAWALYETQIMVTAGFGAIRSELAGLTPVRHGALPAALVGRVPVVFSYFRQQTASRVPCGVPLIGDAIDLARQIYNELSWIEEIHRKTAFPFLAVPERSQGGELDPSTQVKLGPDSAFGYPSETGAPSWVQPSAESTRELRDHALFLAMLALRTTGLEVSGNDTSPDASGEALKVRSRDFDTRCSRFARALASFEREALSLAATILSMPGEATSVTYPKRFTLPSPADDLARAILLVQTFGEKIGPDGVIAATKAALDAALSLSDDQLREIMDGVRKMQGLADQHAVLQQEHAALKASHAGTKQMLGHVLAQNKAGRLVQGNPLASGGSGAPGGAGPDGLSSAADGGA
ncbi:MAG: hypothetical protein IPQ07_38020 [Myxococcales bacterium]|nr:hypothetical protein [Myxococcales bacterium]